MYPFVLHATCAMSPDDLLRKAHPDISKRLILNWLIATFIDTGISGNREQFGEGLRKPVCVHKARMVPAVGPVL